MIKLRQSLLCFYRRAYKLLPEKCIVFICLKLAENITVFGMSFKPKYNDATVGGKHENCGNLNSLPVEDWHGAKVNMITGNIVRFSRGEILRMENRSLLCLADVIKAISEKLPISGTRLQQVHEIVGAYKNLKKQILMWIIYLYTSITAITVTWTRDAKHMNCLS